MFEGTWKLSLGNVPFGFSEELTLFGWISFVSTGGLGINQWP
jgi:hypothetical protein